ncbi:MAG: DUF3105 domain-containing protein, partial [Actinobacteria bacterium]|nr:DUF3105 domain-containing protein [Actinomycetota bacterium]
MADDVGRETGLQLTGDHVAYLIDRKLAPMGITTDSNGSRLAVADSRSALSLRVKSPLLPSPATWFLSGLFSWLFHPVIVVAAVISALAGEIWLFGTQPMGSALTSALSNPTGILLLVGLSIVSAFFHEIGHASACRYGGVRPGPIGCGIYLVWPVFYTDITSTYRLGRSGRLRAVFGGVYFNALLIVLLTLLHLWTGYSVLLAVVLVVNLELIQQLLPTLRFDGYFIVSDWVGVPDLFKYIGPILKRTLLRQPADERLQALKPGPQRVVTAWVLIVVPVLIAQLSFILLQLPEFIAVAWQRVEITGSRTDFLQLMADLAPTAFALLPLAGLMVLGIQAGRGVVRLVVNLGIKEPGDAAGSPQERRRHPAPSTGWHNQSLAMGSLFVVNAVVLVIGGVYLLSGGGSGSTPSARPSRPSALADGPPESRPLAPGGSPTTVAVPGSGQESATAPLFQAVETFSVADRRHTRDLVTYAQTPPVGGPHDPVWEPCRFHDGPVRTERGVH